MFNKYLWICSLTLIYSFLKLLALNCPSQSKIHPGEKKVPGWSYCGLPVAGGVTRELDTFYKGV